MFRLIQIITFFVMLAISSANMLFADERPQSTIRISSHAMLANGINAYFQPEEPTLGRLEGKWRFIGCTGINNTCSLDDSPLAEFIYFERKSDGSFVLLEDIGAETMIEYKHISFIRDVKGNYSSPQSRDLFFQSIVGRTYLMDGWTMIGSDYLVIKGSLFSEIHVVYARDHAGLNLEIVHARSGRVR